MPDKPPPTPDGVIAYLTVSGGDAAMAFYTRAFGAREVFRNIAPDGKRLLHGRLALNNGILMLSDDFPEYSGSPEAPQPGAPTGVTLHVQVADCDAVFNQAVAAGAKPVMPPADMFWGDRYAQVRDPFGHRWSIGSTLGSG